LAVALLALAYYHLNPHLTTYRHLRDIPGPFPVQFKNLRLLFVFRRGDRDRT